jgi:hypothetical protein
MRSIESRRISQSLDALDAAQHRLLSLPLDELKVPELLALLERYVFLRGRVDALRYELANPILRSRKSGSCGGGRQP